MSIFGAPNYLLSFIERHLTASALNVYIYFSKHDLSSYSDGFFMTDVIRVILDVKEFRSMVIFYNIFFINRQVYFISVSGTTNYRTHSIFRNFSFYYRRLKIKRRGFQNMFGISVISA